MKKRGACGTRPIEENCEKRENPLETCRRRSFRGFSYTNMHSFSSQIRSLPSNVVRNSDLKGYGAQTLSFFFK